ncbi:unnamed protein product [Trichobilharzia szidati]|nr:unnamed protein product [Trichobilharzia szidati]
MASKNLLVVRLQPKAAQIVDSRDWSSGICDCFEDQRSCCLTGFCLPCYLCHMYKNMGEACWLPAVGSGALELRIKHRTKHQIAGSLADDYCLSFWCCPLMMCQLQRDLQYVKSLGIES